MTVTESPSTEASRSEDLLRLTNCPQCEYSLHGLPDEGVCPECGFEYDRSVVILRCQGPGAHRLNSHIMLVLAALLGAVFLFVLMFMPRMWANFAQVMLMLAAGSAVLLTIWLDRVTSPRGGDWLLWITSEGIGVQTDLDPDSMLARFRKWGPVVWLPVYMMAGFAPMLFAIPRPIIGVGVMLAFGIGMFFFQRAVEMKPAVPRNGPRPALFAWRDVNRIVLTEVRPGRFRLRTKNDSWVAKNRVVMDVNFDGTNELVGELRQRIAQLGCGKIVSG